MLNVLTQKRNLEIVGILAISLIIFLILPLSVDIFRLNLVGKYLTYAFVAVGLVLCWGYTGILSLGQGIFFGLGGYCMAMFLKLEASSVANTKIQSTPGIPDFMDWNQLHALPLFWKPFHSLTFSLVAVIAVPAIMAFIVGLAMFKRRVGGVYFAIITQAIAAMMTILIIGQQGYTGGVNGITDLRTLLGWDIRTDHAKYILYFVCCVLLIALHAAGAVRALQQARPHPGRHARQGRPRPLLRLRRRQLQDLHLLPGVGHRGYRRRHVHPAGRLHVAVLRRHRAVDRDGDLLRGRRAHLDRRRGLRHPAGQLGEVELLGKLSGAVAVRHGRPVHRGGDRLPARPRRPVHRSNPALARTPRRPARRARGRARRRRSEEKPMSNSTDFLLALEKVTVSFDGFKAVDELNLYIDKGELRVIIGPNGAGKTTVLDLICGRTRVTGGSIKFKDHEITKLKEHEIVKRGIGRKFQTPSIYEDLSVFDNLEISYPRGRNVGGALFWKRSEEIIERVNEIAEMIYLADFLDRRAESSATARSSGWRSACC